MRINELFVQPLKWTWIDQSSSYVSADFKTDKMFYDVHFINMEVDDYEMWDVEFRADAINPKQIPDDGYGITGTGSAAQVMATVLDIINQFVTTHPRVVLYFSAKEESRKKLYERIVKRLNQRAKIVSDSDAAHYYVYFQPQDDEDED